MDFSLNETQNQVKQLAAQIFAKETTQERLRALDAVGYQDSALCRQLAESGLLSLTLDDASGGIGESFETLCVLLEEAARYVAPVPLLEMLVTGVTALQGVPENTALTDALQVLASGEGVVTAALYEEAQPDQLSVKARATQTDGQWFLTGQKDRVPMADSPGACWTLAQTEDGPGAFLFDLQGPGIHRERQTTTSGEYVFRLGLQAVPAVLLVRGAAALTLMERAELFGMAASSAMAVGVCAEMTRMSATYGSERKQFGKPIASFQAVAHLLADCYIETEALRGVAQQAICRLTEPGISDETREAVLTAKIFAAQALHRVSHACQQVHGGTGVDRDYGLFRYCLMAKKLELEFGGQARLLQRLGDLLVAA
ncbi:hypothetical protein BK648_24800 [Pseudomonas poae]|uniref:Acyl-CoA dehydrogenase n=1 Tax=Pseudomonas poae TaxID=200451 RepID=A0A423ERS4_9PSED|nr:acyl-CoA dehydrogenase family protein [Pseudomonas poae]ROM33980.1 hypothetical protein BK648_24800 [Pseudomonas poae]